MDRTQVSPTTIRHVGPADLAALSEFFAGLSIRTRYRRFFAAITPTAAMLRMLSGGAGNVDAVVAIREGTIIGHAMAADRADAAGAWKTDIGVVIADAWQGHGVGSALMRTLLTAAQARGVSSVVMDVLPSNEQVLAMIARHWPTACTGHETDLAIVQVRLPHSGPQAPAWPAASLPVTARQDEHPPVRTPPRLPVKRSHALTGSHPS